MISLREHLKKMNRLEQLQKGNYSSEITSTGFSIQEAYNEKLKSKVQQKTQELMASSTATNNNQTIKNNNIQVNIPQVKSNMQQMKFNTGTGFRSTAKTTTTPIKISNTQNTDTNELPTIEEIKNKKNNVPQKYDGIKDVETYFTKGAFKDGYQVGDVTKTVGSTLADAGTNVVKGVMGVGESTGDLINLGRAYLAEKQGNTQKAEKLKKIATTNTVEDFFTGKYNSGINALDNSSKMVSKAHNAIENNSVLGEKSDALANSLGYVAAMMALQHVGVPWQVTAGVTSFGGEMTQAIGNGASWGEAIVSSAISAGAEIGSEYLSGGIIKLKGTGKTLDKLFESSLGKINNNFVRAFAKYGIDMAGEGVEEIISSVGHALGKGITYGKESDSVEGRIKGIINALEDENFVDDFIGGTVSAGLLGVGKTANSIKSIKSNNTLARNEIIDSSNLGENSKAQLKRLSEKNNWTVENLRNMLEQGGNLNSQSKAKKQSTELTNNEILKSNQQITQEQNKMAENGNTEQITVNEDLKVKIPGSNYKFEASGNQKVDNLRQDAHKYFNNSEKAKNYVGMLEKIITDKNIDIRLDANLKTPDGKIANGSYSNGVITINPNSTKAGEFIAVHELTHAIGTKNMLNIVENYRKSNAEFDGAVQNLLKNYKSTELTEEALSDVSAQLFGNQEFINNVAQNNPNIFQKIYNEIKYLWHQFRGYKNQDQFIEDLYYKWTQAYKSNDKLSEKNKYLIETNNKGYKYVKADRQVISGNNPKEWQKQTQKYINDKIRNGQDINVLTDSGEILTITKDTAGKAKFRNEILRADGTKTTMSDNELLTKLTAETHIDELAQVSTKINQKTVPDTKNHKFAKDGFDYRRAYFEDFDGQYYRITMSVGKNGSINTIYNIGRLDNQTLKNKKNRSKSSVTAQRPLSQKTNEEDLSSINSIPSQNKDVNTTTKYSIQESENNSGSFNLSKEKQERLKELKAIDTSNMGFLERSKINQEIRAIENGFDTVEDYIKSEKEKREIASKEAEKEREERLKKIEEQEKEHEGYQMTHRPTESGAYASNISDNGFVPKDVYEHPEWYFDMNRDFTKESFDIIKKIKGNPEAEITIYRATPSNTINKGDWVTLSKKYAEYHKESNLNGKGNIVELKVKAKDVQYAGDDINEFGYFPNEEKYSLPTKEWQQYLDENYKPTGTRTNLEDIKQSNQDTIENSNESSFSMQEDQTRMPEQVWMPGAKDKTKARKHYDSIIKSNYVSDEAKAIAKELMGTDTYVPETNEGQLREADERIKNSGADSELDSLLSRAMTGGEIKSVDIAVGERLIQYYSKTGDKTKLQEAIQATAMAGTTAGQTVQALSLLNHQTPEGQAIWIQRCVEKMNYDLARKKGGTIVKNDDGSVSVINKTGKDITNKVELFDFTPEMMAKITNSTDSEQLYANLNEVYEELGEQVSKSIGEKIDSWRYFSMLANPRTHIRNIVGNITMGGTQRLLKNKVAGMIESVVNVANPDMERNHTIVPASEEVKEFAKNDIKNVEDRLGLNDNKYNPKNRMQSNMRTFKTNALENTIGKAFNLNDKTLEVEDGWGLKAGYRNALAEYMTANNLTPKNITDKQLGKARNYAIEQAKTATFHQESSLATLINQLSKKNTATKLLVDAVSPFVKTPINVAKTSVAYSPINLAKSIVYDSVQLRKGNITINKYIDNISKGLTGSGITLVGYMLAEAGILKASGGDDEKSEFEENQGKQVYSIQIGDNTYSLDWLSPLAIPLFMGAEISELKKAKQKEKASSSDDDVFSNQVIQSLENMVNAFATAMNPMMEMSMISSLTSTLTSYEEDKVSAMLVNAGKSYVNQFIPTALRQVAKTTDEYERKTTSTKTGLITKAVDSTKMYVMSSLPGLRQKLPVKTDIWGNEQKQSTNIIQRALENAVLPYNRKSVSSNKVNNELSNLYDETGDGAVLPNGIDKKISINSQDYRLTNEEFAKYSKDYGQNSYKLLNDLVSSKSYTNLSADEKVKAISNVYDYAKEVNKVDYATKVSQEYKTSTLYNTVNEINKQKANVSSYFEYQAHTQGMKKDIEKIQTLKDMDTDTKTRSIIYEQTLVDDDSTEYEELKEYYANNSALGAKNQRAYEIIDQYIDYKVKADDKIKELRANGTKTEDQKLTEVERIQLLKDCNYNNVQTEALYSTVVAEETGHKIYEELKKLNGKNSIQSYMTFMLSDRESVKEDDGTLSGKSISGSKLHKVQNTLKGMGQLNTISKIYLEATQASIKKYAPRDYAVLKNYLNNASDAEQTIIMETIQGTTKMKNGKYKY